LEALFSFDRRTQIFFLKAYIRKKSYENVVRDLQYGFPVLRFLRDEARRRIEEGHFEHLL